MDKSQFLPIRVSTLKGGVSLGFDVFIELPHKLLMYVRGDYDIEQERLAALKTKKVRKLFINEASEEQYQQYIDRCLSSLNDDPDLGIEDKAKMVVGAGECTAERIFDTPDQLRTYKAAASTSLNLKNVLGSNSDLLKSIFDHGEKTENKDHDSLMHRHSVNTASLCISFAEYLKQPSESIETLGIAGLYHDVAYGEYDASVKELFFKKLEDMSLEEQKIYKEHPARAKEMLKDKDFINPEVLDLIYTHEEKLQANGFPQGIKVLTPVQEILSICAFYDRCTTCLGMTRKDVLDDFKMNQLGNYNLETMNQFKAFIKKSGL